MWIDLNGLSHGRYVPVRRIHDHTHHAVTTLTMNTLGDILEVEGYSSDVGFPDMATVPNLAGLEQGVALNALAGDFQGVVESEPSDDVALGLVIRTDPAQGSSLEKGSTVTLFISTGPPPRVLPDVVGKTANEATDALQELGLGVTQADPVFDEEVPVGVVVSWSVPESPTLRAGDTVVKGTVVHIVVSAGPEPRTVPDLTGKSLSQASAALRALGLVVATLPDEFSATVPAGSVAQIGRAHV